MDRDSNSASSLQKNNGENRKVLGVGAVNHIRQQNPPTPKFSQKKCCEMGFLIESTV